MQVVPGAGEGAARAKRRWGEWDRAAQTEPGRPASAGADAARPVEAFHHAVAAMLTDVANSEAERAHSMQAADALIAGAIARDPFVTGALRPDPSDEGAVTWTVACYQIGDLSPTTLQDFPDAEAAVEAVADCPQAGHVAAELLASTSSGLRWTAIVRTGSTLSFQLLSDASASSADPDGLIEAARERWTAHLDTLLTEQAAAERSSCSPLEGGRVDVRLVLEDIRSVLDSLARQVDRLIAAQEVDASSSPETSEVAARASAESTLQTDRGLQGEGRPWSG